MSVKWGYGNPGLPGGTVTWSFASEGSEIDSFEFVRSIDPDLRQAVRDAFDRWGSVAQIDFVETPHSNQTNISIGFYDLDGNGPVWGSGSFPAAYLDVAAGNTYATFTEYHIFLDAAEPWADSRNTFTGGYPLYLATLHQVGNAIGVPDSGVIGSVMTSILYNTTLDLSPDDVAAVRAIYGFRELPIAPSELDDTFTSTAGDDVVDGRQGFDTIRYTGSRDGFSIERNGDTLLISGHGRDQLENVEEIIFDDGRLSFDFNGIPGVAYRLYQAAFDRTPDTAGLSYWINSMNSGVNAYEVAKNFMNSTEFLNAYGANPTNREFVEKLYQNVLGREGETEGVAFWLDALDSGRSDRANVLGSIAQSPENVSGVAPLIADGIWYI
ncbi:MAG: DUF4214 domain-containing protein [Pseudomonadota bacterium]|nr:DUF4214 domain-containing protein [Pseudomonadota bacterium]